MSDRRRAPSRRTDIPARFRAGSCHVAAATVTLRRVRIDPELDRADRRQHRAEPQPRRRAWSRTSSPSTPSRSRTTSAGGTPQLKTYGAKNDEIFARIAAELADRVVAAPALTERQLRRLVYG